MEFPNTSFAVAFISATLNLEPTFILISSCSEYFNPTLKPTVAVTIVPAIVIIISYILIAVGISLYYTSLFVTYSTSAINGYVFIAIIGFILLIASSIWATTKYYFYQLAFLISIENEDMSAEEAVTESQKAMTGKRASLFWLQLSFIGWAILGAISFGIGFLWIIPYVHCATIAFYKYAIGDSSTVEVQSIDDDSKTAE